MEQHARIQSVYCNMDELCGESAGGWMRVGYLNMTDDNETCPMGFQTYDVNSIRSCGRSPRSNDIKSYCESVTLHMVLTTLKCVVELLDTK